MSWQPLYFGPDWRWGWRLRWACFRLVLCCGVVTALGGPAWPGVLGAATGELVLTVFWAVVGKRQDTPYLERK